MTDTVEGQRDELWAEWWKLYYHCYYEELALEYKIVRWEAFDEWGRLLIAGTATSSAIASWGVWEWPYVSWVWVIAGHVAAAVALVHVNFGLKGKLEKGVKALRDYKWLRLELETFRLRMSCDWGFSPEPIREELIGLRRRFGEVKGNLEPGIELRGKTTHEIQDKVDALTRSESQSYE